MGRGGRFSTKKGILAAIVGFCAILPAIGGVYLHGNEANSVSIAPRRIALKEHKFHLGQSVYFTSRPIGHMIANSTYEVVRLLPSDGADFQYRIKNPKEAFERVVRESQIEYSP